MLSSACGMAAAFMNTVTFTITDEGGTQSNSLRRYCNQWLLREGDVFFSDAVMPPTPSLGNNRQTLQEATLVKLSGSFKK